jgi:hypothetical protein
MTLIQVMPSLLLDSSWDRFGRRQILTNASLGVRKKRRHWSHSEVLFAAR